MDRLNMRFDLFNLKDELHQELLLRTIEIKPLDFIVRHFPLPVTITDGKSSSMTHHRHVRSVGALWDPCNDDPFGGRHFETSDLQLNDVWLDVINRKIAL
jgi:hypothetical protein